MPAKRRAPLRPTPKPKAIKSKTDLPSASDSDVRLVATKGSKGRGGDDGGEAWRIDAWGKRAGVIFINFIDEPPLGQHASIQIYLNAKSQGRHVGSIAYRMACEQTRYAVVYAHMRKANLPSIRAAENAGFVDATPDGHIQKIMVRDRRETR